jgi:uncharacterized protein
MLYNVAQLLKEAPGTTMDVEVDSDDSLDLRDGEAELAGPVTGSLRLHRTNQGVYVDGTIQADVRLECTRCLRPFTETLTFSLRQWMARTMTTPSPSTNIIRSICASRFARRWCWRCR